MKIREEILHFPEYEPKSGEAKIRMDKNECPFDLPEALKEELGRRLEDSSLNRYPQINSDPLREKIARFAGLNRGNVLVGNGSDELIPYVFKLFEGEEIVVNPPTFSMYEFYGSLEGLEVNELPLKEDFSLPVEEIKRNLDNARATVINSPNNPTGNSHSREKILELLETGTPIILDEAYQEFAPADNLDLIGDYENLIVLRTFSKACGLAGARVGYAAGADKVIKNLLKIKSPFNVNRLSRETAEIILDNSDLIEKRVERIKDERERIRKNFPRVSYPSDTNFLLMKVNAREHLLEDGIAVRGFGGRLKNFIRVTVGRKEENEKFMDSLKGYLNDQNLR